MYRAEFSPSATKPRLTGLTYRPLRARATTSTDAESISTAVYKDTLAITVALPAGNGRDFATLVSRRDGSWSRIGLPESLSGSSSAIAVLAEDHALMAGPEGKLTRFALR